MVYRIVMSLYCSAFLKPTIALLVAMIALPPLCPVQAAEDAAQAVEAEKPAATEKSKTVAELTAATRDAVVVIKYHGRDGQSKGVGTGFIISADGLIATNYHVIGDARPISVTLRDGKSFDVVEVHATERLADLAIVRIDAKDLPVLPLGDSSAVTQGQPAVVLGNPLGLEHSVVSGVISGTRDIDGHSMLQLAMPIEPGNSGGPVLNMNGEVEGIVSLKSTISENLGFAVPINALKPLLEKPNPVPMSRWLTIGALDETQWTTLFGATWRQRAGRIQVKGLGDGFGGRSLCLWHEAVAEFPQEIAVAVRMEQEDGAAGIVFHADGDNRHYGFYPSSGKMRLSRFDGPDVYAWQVLEEKPSEHYKPGEWNWLKVHLDADRFRCYVNDELVFESSDAVYTGGKAGLAKFRHTEAEFKGFRIAAEIAPLMPDGELIAKLREQIRVLPLKRPPPRELVEQLPDDPLAQTLVLEEQAKELEQRAERVRQLAKEIQLHHTHRALGEEMAKPEADVDLLKASLLLAKLDNPELDIDAYLAQVERMAKEIATPFTAETAEAEKLAALNRHLFQQLGFHGSRTDYYNRSNSYLNEVLDDREGLPITLSVLYIELARRLGLNVVGVGLPGHFVVRYEPKDGEPQLIDVFDGGTVFAKDIAAIRVQQATGRPIDEADLAAQSKRAIVTRMLHNLMGVARDAADAEGMLRYVDTLVELNPQAGQERWYRAVLQFQTKRADEALLDTNWLLDHQPQGVNLDQVRELQTILETEARGK